MVKKNKTVLDRLLKWIHNHVADSRDSDGHPLVSGFPLLLVDDEADHASVDTGDQEVGTDGKVLDEEYQPTVINSRIRRILHTFSRKVYVGYTATPFANVFIDRRKETRREGPDLFPRSFIINLPAPSDYVGPVQVFGLKTPEGRQGGLPLVRQISEREVSAGQGGWMPARHTSRHIPQFEKRDELPPSLREAIAVFALCCAVRVLRGQGGRHCSMLIHVTRFTTSRIMCTGRWGCWFGIIVHVSAVLARWKGMRFSRSGSSCGMMILFLHQDEWLIFPVKEGPVSSFLPGRMWLRFCLKLWRISLTVSGSLTL